MADKQKDIMEILAKRKLQFEDFLYKICPEDKRDLLNMIKSKSPEQFVSYFRFFVLPLHDRLEESVKMIMMTNKISEGEVSQDDIDILIEYLRIFCEFIELLDLH